jgi:hypothetical protein
MYMTSPTRIAPSAISAQPHHSNPPLPEVSVPVVCGVTCTVVVRLVTEVVLFVRVSVTVFVFGGSVTVSVVVRVRVSVVWPVVVVPVSVVATGSAVAVGAVSDAAVAVERLVLACDATLDAADLASWATFPEPHPPINQASAAPATSAGISFRSTNTCIDLP